MATTPGDDALDALSSKELHDLAVRYALRHLDIPFFYRLMRALPVAEAAIGDVKEAEADALTLRAHIDDVVQPALTEIEGVGLVRVMGGRVIG